MSESSSTPKEELTELPPPIEIAKVAAILSQGRNLDRKKAIDEAIALCLQAGLRYEELVELRLDQIVMELGDTALLDLALKKINRPKKLRLYPDGAKIDPETKSRFFQAGLDPVRHYLAKRAPNLNWNKSRTVREAIELFHLDHTHIHNEENAKAIRSLERKHEKMAKELAKESGKPLDFRDGMDIPDQQRRLNGPTMFDHFMDGCAVWDESHSEGSGQNHGMKRPKRVLYWEFEQPFLNALVRWRLDVKKRGGIKVVAKTAKKYWARR